MRKSVMLVVAFALIAGALAAPATAAKKKTRVAEQSYAGTMCVESAPCAFWQGSPVGNISAVSFPMGVGEKYVTIEITDESGMPVRGGISVDKDGTPETQETSIASFCGKTPKPVKVDQGPITVFVGSGTCDGEPTVATYGTITATFSNIP